jgi:hypothetical protein
MSAIDISHIESEAIMEIHAQRENSFRHVKANGIKKSALDDFESFLTAPGTLSRPSLIVRCQIADGTCTARVVVDKCIMHFPNLAADQSSLS